MLTSNNLKLKRFLILSFCGSLINDLNAQPSKTRANDSGLLTVLGGRSKPLHRGAFQSPKSIYQCTTKRPRCSKNHGRSCQVSLTSQKRRYLSLASLGIKTSRISQQVKNEEKRFLFLVYHRGQYQRSPKFKSALLWGGFSMIVPK